MFFIVFHCFSKGFQERRQKTVSARVGGGFIYETKEPRPPPPPDPLERLSVEPSEAKSAGDGPFERLAQRLVPGVCQEGKPAKAFCLSTKGKQARYSLGLTLGCTEWQFTCPNDS